MTSTLPTDVPETLFCARRALAALRSADVAAAEDKDAAWVAACSSAASAWVALGQLVATIEASS